MTKWEPLDRKNLAHQEERSRDCRVRPDPSFGVGPRSVDRTPTSRVLRVLSVDSSILSFRLVQVLNDLFGAVNVKSVRSIGELLELSGGSEQFDLVVVDARVPDINGFDGLKRAVSSLPEACFIVTSPHEEPADIFGAIRAGARGFISMSSPLDVLRYALPLIIKGEFYVPASAFRSGKLWSAHGEPALVAGAARPPAAATLTRRQSEVLLMLAAGKSNKEIARHLNLIDGTVKLHVRAILRKLSVNNRTQAVMAAARAGYFREDHRA